MERKLTGGEAQARSPFLAPIPLQNHPPRNLRAEGGTEGSQLRRRQAPPRSPKRFVIVWVSFTADKCGHYQRGWNRATPSLIPSSQLGLRESFSPAPPKGEDMPGQGGCHAKRWRSRRGGGHWSQAALAQPQQPHFVDVSIAVTRWWPGGDRVLGFPPGRGGVRQLLPHHQPL